MDPRDVCWLDEVEIHCPAMIDVDSNWNTRTSDGVFLTRCQLSQGMFVFSYAWTWSLLISDASEDDAGEYTCRVSSDDRTLTVIKRFNFTVLSKH